MSDLLPLFPLPNVVLFPNVFLPLHIFESRYRELVSDAIATDRLIGMVLLRPGWEHEYEGQPAVYPIGCSGVITHLERLQDGRFNIVLRGMQRFRIESENHERSYRRGLVQSLEEPTISGDDRDALRRMRSKLEALLAPAGTGESRPAEPSVPADMPDEDLVNALAQYLDLDPIEKQALLEIDRLRARAESLVELLEMKMMMARTPGAIIIAH